MRDLESISIALTLAETGHLVFATLHTNDAPQALDRIVDVFPAERRDQIQIMLAAPLQGVISQRLLPGIAGGRAGVRGAGRQRRGPQPGARGQEPSDAQPDHHRWWRRHADAGDRPGPPRERRPRRPRHRLRGEPVPERRASQMATQRATAGAQATIAAGQAAASANGVATRTADVQPDAAAVVAGAVATRSAGAASDERRPADAVQDDRRGHAVPRRLAGAVRPSRGRHGRGRGAVRAPDARRRRRLAPQLDAVAINVPFGLHDEPTGPYRPCDEEA